MVIKFSNEFGLEADRKKLAAGVGNFEITHIVMSESKKLYEVKADDGKTSMQKIPIVHFDVVQKDGAVAKYYSPNGPIIQACKDMLDKYGTKDKSGKLRESIFIAEVQEAGTKGREYLCFK
jgi:hypothetical protein